MKDKQHQGELINANGLRGTQAGFGRTVAGLIKDNCGWIREYHVIPPPPPNRINVILRQKLLYTVLYSFYWRGGGGGGVSSKCNWENAPLLRLASCCTDVKGTGLQDFYPLTLSLTKLSDLDPILHAELCGKWLRFRKDIGQDRIIYFTDRSTYVHT